MTVPLSISETFMQALLWMLVHSLWQGLAAAALAGAVIVCTRKQSAAMRYNLLVLVYCLFLLAVAGTFRWCYQGYDSSSTASWLQRTAAPQAAAHAGADLQSATVPYAWLQPLGQFINQNSATIIVLWLMVLLFKALRLILNYRQVLVLRSRKLGPVDTYWHNRLQDLCQVLGVTRAVGFFQSGLIKVPMVVGYFKPVLLVPAGFLNSLPPEDVEAILVHELAHIWRSDYLVNMMQHFMELVFFFNLPVLWISDQIRKEREHSCDDIAVAHSGNKRGYINALVAFQKQGGANVYATAFSGTKMPLLDRVKRLIYNNNQTLSTMEKISLLTGVLAVSFIAFAFNTKTADKAPDQIIAVERTKKEPARQPTAIAEQITIASVSQNAVALPSTKKQEKRRLVPAADTSGKGRTEANSTINGKRYRMVLEQEKLVELYVDGVQVPESRFHEYSDVVKTLLEHKAKAEEHAKVAQEHAKKAEEHARVAEANARKAEANSREAQSQALEAEKHAAKLKEHTQQAEEHARRAEEHATKAQVHAKHAQVHAKVYTELVKDGLIKEQETNVSYTIKDGKMIINGVEQPREVYQKYQKLIDEEKKRLGIQ